MDFSKVEDEMRILYIGDSFAFGGAYRVIKAESTYNKEYDCPEDERGKLVIVEFMNNGNPMFFTLEMLNPNEWELVE